ncbi:MAG: TonB-dependent receptor [Planctomycetota bacterium]
MPSLLLLPLVLAPLQEEPVSETVVVAPRSETTVTSTAAKVTVVSEEDLEATGERSLPRAIGRAAGVWIQESHLGGGAPVVRGLLGNQILVVVDGVRVNDSTTRFGPNETLNQIDPATVERVEIIHGSSSVLYGSDAIGGVIAIWTKHRSPRGERSAETRPAAEGFLDTLWDSASGGRRATLGATGATARHGGLAIASGYDYGNLEAGDGVEQHATAFHGNSAFGAWDWSLGAEKNLRLTGMAHRDFDVPRTFNLVPGYGQTEPSYAQYVFLVQDRRRAVLTYDDRDPAWLADDLQVRLSLREYTEERLRQKTGSPTLTFERHDVETVGLGADLRRRLGEDQLLTWGFDLDHDEVDAFRTDTDTTTGGTSAGDGAFPPGARYTAFGAFVQDEVLAFAPTYLTLGLRWSHFEFGFDDFATGARVDGDFDALTASVEAARDLSDDVRVEATVAQGFQAPNLEDLANDGDFAGGTEIANPDLDPARSVMGEVAIEVAKPAWSATAALFGTKIGDYIGRRLLDAGDPDVAGDELYQRENAGEVRLWGTEVTGARELGAAGSPWSVDGAVAWVRGRQYDGTVDPTTGRAPLNGVDLRRAPPLNGRVGLRWTDRGAGAHLETAELAWIWAARQDELHPEDISDPRIDPDGTAAWSVLDLDLGGTIRPGLRWSLGLHNLLDERYRVHGSGVDGPGRSLVVDLLASF